MKNTIKLAMLSAVLLLANSAFAGGSAKKEFNENHPRRAEVNQRLDNQNKRIHEERKIRREELRDARKHGGNITKNEQRQLNREENRFSRQIGRKN